MRRVFLFLLFFLVSIIGLFLFSQNFNQNKFEVIFFDVGQGDSALINFENGAKMLVDCGKGKKILYKLGKYLPFFDRQIDYLLISHFDLDHYGGCIDVLKRYDVKNLIVSNIKGDDDYYLEFEKVAGSEPEMKIKTINSYEQVNIGSSTLVFLSPLEEFNFTDKNDASIVFKLVNSITTILFVGDLEEKGEELILQKYCGVNNNLKMASSDCIVESQILKVGHHGSAGSSSEDFLQLVNPQTATISVGENSFGHPSLRVLKKIERLNAEILRTDEIGDIIVRE